MSLVRPTPAFVPPVVAIPAANNIVPLLPGIIGATAGTTATIAGAPALAVIGASIAGAVLGGVIANATWGWANGRKEKTTSRYPDLAGYPDDKVAAVPDPGSLTRYEVETPETYSQYRYIDSVTGPVLYLLPGEWPGHSNPTITYTRQLRLRWTGANGVDYDVIPTFFWQWREDTVVSRIARVRVVGAGEYPPLVPIDDPIPPPPLPLPEPLPEPLPQPPTRTAVCPPLTVPTFPKERPSSPVPVAPPSPGTPTRTAPPAPAPVTPLRPFPSWPVQPRPDGTRTQPDGTLAPTPKARPTATSTDTHVVDGIPIPGNGPRPTPEEMAKELGRIENKLARLLDPKSDGPGQPKDRFSWLRDNITNIVDFFFSIQAGGTYELSSPCEVDENGDRIVRTVEYAGASQSLGVLNNKLDALAALLQEHKDLKQPICRQTPAVGEPVTVNFVQVD